MKKFIEKASENYQIPFRSNKELENVFRTYETSWETQRLESERKRKIFCELINFGGLKEVLKDVSETSLKNNVVPDVNIVADDESEEEEQKVVINKQDNKSSWWRKISVQPNRPKTLAEISNQVISKAFTFGKVDERIICQDAVDFGLMADIDLPILNLLELNNETFWERVVESKIHDHLKFQLSKREPSIKWKKIGFEVKMIEYIESLDVEDFDAPETKEYLNILSDKLVSIVEDLSIQQIKPRRHFGRNPHNPISRVVNVSANESFHGSFEFLGRFSNLKSLKLRFDPGNLKLKYERRLFFVSIVDIENVGKALMSLKKLENFIIHKSDLSESVKVYHLLKPMAAMGHLKVLDFSFCRISSKESGEHFNNFLSVCKSLESLDLKGNNLTSDFCLGLARGIQNFEGKLEFLGLSFAIGLQNILRAIREKDNVKRLNISNCCNFTHDEGDNEACSDELIALLAKAPKTLIEINMNGVNFMSEENNEKFINALCKNFQIDEIHCQDCGFSTEQMVKIKVLLARNKYYKQNPILKKDQFSVEDEAEIEKFLKRTKHPLIIKYKQNLEPKR